MTRPPPEEEVIEKIRKAGSRYHRFHIPEARRQDKPVYLGGDIRKSFIRRGAGDERCTPGEIEGFLRDAATVDLDPGRCFDDESVRWYRARFYDRNPDHDESLSHPDFLHHWGLIVETGGRLLPTRAAVLLFGADPAFRHVQPRPVVDCQWRRGDWSEELQEERWADRLVIETNLVKTWRALVERDLQRAECCLDLRVIRFPFVRTFRLPAASTSANSAACAFSRYASASSCENA